MRLAARWQIGSWPISSSCSSSRFVQVRYLRSTPTTAFLFGQSKSAPTVAKIFKDLEDAEKRDRLDLVVTLYPSLRQCLHNSVGPPDVVSAVKPLLSLMKFVAKSGRSDLLLNIFDDLPLFGIGSGDAHHDVILQGLANMGQADKAMKWIQQMKETRDFIPSTSQWNMVLSSFRGNVDLSGLTSALSSMKKSGTPRNIETYNTIISVYCDVLQMKNARKMVFKMKEDGILPNITTETLLLAGFVNVKDLESAREVQERLELVVESRKKGEDLKEIAAAVNALIHYKCAASGFASGFRLAERFKNEGQQFDSSTLNTLALEGASSVHSVEEAIDLTEQLEKAIRVSSTTQTWTILLKSILDGPGGVKEGLKLYEEARFRDIQPDSDMAYALLSALFQHGSSREKLIQAKRIYSDLRGPTKAFHSAPDIKVYTVLLKSCADAAFSDVDFSNTLVSDMKTAGLRLSPRALTWHIVAMIQACEDHVEAFEAYEGFRDLDPSALTQESFNVILQTYLYVKYPPDFDGKTYYANSVSVYKILEDMRRLGQPPTAKTYSILLHYFSKQPAADLRAIVQIHALIKLENSFDPDTGLFNTLMMAYGRLGAFEAAFRIWQSLKLSHARGGPAGADNHSVSIILDIYGWSSEQTQAGKRSLHFSGRESLKETWTNLRLEEKNDMMSIKLNRKNWESYMEALCRRGDYKEAENLVFDDMVDVGNGGVGVGVSTLETLLKFSRRAEEGTWDKLRIKIQQVLPELWDSVKEVALKPNVNRQTPSST